MSLSDVDHELHQASARQRTAQQKKRDEKYQKYIERKSRRFERRVTKMVRATLDQARQNYRNGGRAVATYRLKNRELRDQHEITSHRMQPADMYFIRLAEPYLDGAILEVTTQRALLGRSNVIIFTVSLT